MPLFNFIKSKLSILDIISEYVQLRPAGSYFKGPCPIHHEKEASFTVSPDKQIFYCFGCHAGGDLVSFISKVENLSQFESAKYLVDKYQLQVPSDIQKGAFKKLSKNNEKKNNYFDLCQVVALWAHKRLQQSDVVKKYLNQRDIDLKQVKHFNIGYFAGGVRVINSFLKEMSSHGFLAKDFIEAGILMEGRSVLYSPFEERIIFPIKDIVGRYSGFGGRVFKAADQRARYYNSKESEWFLKGKLLFGIDLAKKEMQKKKTAYLVEGYTDCVAMVKNGYRNTIATLGTACTKDHLKILSRYINTLYVLYDGDQAGQKAILRLTRLCWDVNLELQIIKLPKGEDPASFLQSGGDLASFINQSSNIFAFFIQSLGTDFLKSSLSEKLVLSEKIVEVVSKLQDSFKQELLLQQAATVMQVPLSSLKDLLDKNNGRNGYFLEKRTCEKMKKTGKNTKSNEKDVPLLEERIFSAIINSIDKADKFNVEADLISYFSEYIQFLLRKIEVFSIKMTSSPKKFSDFVDGLNEIDRDWVIRCSLKFEQSVSKDLFDQLIFHFCKQNWKRIVGDMKLKLSRAKQQNDQKRLKELFVLFSKLKDGMLNRGLI